MAVDKPYFKSEHVIQAGVYDYPIPWSYTNQTDVVLYIIINNTKSMLPTSSYNILVNDVQTVRVLASIINQYVGGILSIERYTPRTQPLQLYPKTPISPETLETELDRIVRQIQELDEYALNDDDARLLLEELTRVKEQLENALASEAAIRAEEDRKNTVRIQDEETSRMAADADLSARISQEVIDRTNADTILTNGLVDANNRIDTLGKLGRWIGTYNTQNDLPGTRSGLPAGADINDFANVRVDSNHGNLATRYIIANISSTGVVTWAFDIALSTDVTGKADKVSGSVVGNVASLTADGNLADGGVPVNDIQRKSQPYSDPNKLSKSGDTMAGNIDMAGHWLSNVANPVNDGDAVNYGTLKSNINENALPLTGGTMRGDIEMANYRITGLPAPVISSDAVNLEALNNAIGQGGTFDHSELRNRDAVDQHPITAITGLATELDRLGSDKEGSLFKREDNEVILQRNPTNIYAGGDLTGEGTMNHNELNGRNLVDQHPMSAITGLQAEFQQVAMNISAAVKTETDAREVDVENLVASINNLNDRVTALENKG